MTRGRWITTGAAVIVYGLILHWTYQNRIAPLFGYLGSRYRDPDPFNYALSYGLALSLLIVMPRAIEKASDFVVWLLYIMTAVPAITVPQYADILEPGKSIELAVVVTLNFAIVAFLAGRGPSGSLRVRVPAALFWQGIAAFSALFYAYLFVTTGLRFTFVSLGEVRDIRFDYRDTIASGGAALGYLIRIQANVINPLLLARGTLTSRWWMAGAGAVGQLLIFSITGYKMTILSIPALIGIALVFRYAPTIRGRLLVLGTIATALTALAVDAAQSSMIYTALFIDRLLLVPGTLTAAHVLVFDGQPKDNFAHSSFLGWATSSEYATSPAFYVGAAFSGDARTSANANFFADGFANYGYVGITIEALVLVGILWLINATTRHLPIGLASLLMVVPTLNLVNASVFTSLLTGGFAFAIAVAAAMPDDERPHARPRSGARRPATRSRHQLRA